jgi:hypothetical protein
MKASLTHRNSLAFKRTSLEALVRYKGRIITFLKEKETPLLEYFDRKAYLANILTV